MFIGLLKTLLSLASVYGMILNYVQKSSVQKISAEQYLVKRFWWGFDHFGEKFRWKS